MSTDEGDEGRAEPTDNYGNEDDDEDEEVGLGVQGRQGHQVGD